MSVNIKRNGTLQKIADQTLIFQANSAETRSGTITVPAISDMNDNQSVQVVFSGPMPDTNYEVIIDEGADTWAHLTATVTNKTTTGFTLMVVTLVPNMPQLNFHYTAFKLVTLEGYSLVQSKVSNPDSMPVENSTNLVTSGGVYDAIKNASSVFIGTSSEWESESAKTDYQVAILTDQPNVNAVDSTTGSTTVVANKHLVFKGTLEEWEALTTAEKKTYDEALITNDMDTGEVVNGVTDGDMRAVTSNAVYDAINSGLPNIIRLIKTYNNVSIPSAGYVTLDSMVSFPSNYKTYTLIGIVILGADYTFSKPLSIIRGSDTTTIYALGAEQTVNTITVGYVLCNKVTDIT